MATEETSTERAIRAVREDQTRRIVEWLRWRAAQYRADDFGEVTAGTVEATAGDIEREFDTYEPGERLMACDKCDGKGKISYRTLGDASPIDMGNGLSVQAMGGWSTRACVCVRDLPATDGKATWWESETIYNEVVSVPIGCEAVEITADSEVPRGPDGRRYHRTPENAYYPLLIRLEMECAATLHSDTAREIAAALVAAADACDAVDALTLATGEPQMSRRLSCPNCGETDTVYFRGEWDPADWPGGPALCGCPSSNYEFGPCEPVTP